MLSSDTRLAASEASSIEICYLNLDLTFYFRGPLFLVGLLELLEILLSRNDSYEVFI